MIDEIYRKERQYVPSYDKDNILQIRSPIFELQKYHNLKSQTGVETHNKAPSQQTHYVQKLPTLSEEPPSQLSLINQIKLN